MIPFKADLLKRFGGGQEGRDTLADLGRHGADAGWPGLTYYTDTTALYEKHHDEIWDALYEDAQSLGSANVLTLIAGFGGAENVGSQEQFANLLVWYMAELVAREDEP